MYLTARDGKFPRGPLNDGDLRALKKFVGQHPDLNGRCGVTEAEMGVLLNAADGVRDDSR
jgi:hypothetical protein